MRHSVDRIFTLRSKLKFGFDIGYLAAVVFSRNILPVFLRSRLASPCKVLLADYEYSYLR